MNRWGKDWAPYKTVKTVPIPSKSALMHFKQPGWQGYIKETLPDKATLKYNLSKVRASDVDDEGDELDQISDMLAQRKAHDSLKRATGEERILTSSRQRLLANAEATGGAAAKAAAAEESAPKAKEAAAKTDKALKEYGEASEKVGRRGAPKLSPALVAELAVIAIAGEAAGKSKAAIKNEQRIYKKNYKETASKDKDAARKAALEAAKAKKSGAAPAAVVGGGSSPSPAAAIEEVVEEAGEKRGELSTSELQKIFTENSITSLAELKEAVSKLDMMELADFAFALGIELEDASGRALKRKAIIDLMETKLVKSLEKKKD